MSIQQMIDGEREAQTDIDENEGAEVELTNEDLSTSEATAEEDAKAKADAAAAAAAADKHKNRVPAEKRIGKLTREKKEAQEYAGSLEAELQKERERSAKLAQDKAASDRAAFVHYERSVDANLKDAKRAHADALASGDPEKITEAATELSKWTAEKTEVDRFRARMPKESAEPARETRQPAAEERQRQPERQAPDLAPEAKDWATKTSWFNPDSDDFNQEMHTEAVQFAQQLERRFIRQGRGDEIGRSAEYFQAITDHVKSEFPDEFGDTIDITNGAANGAANGSKTPAMPAGRPDNAAPRNGAAPAAVGSTPSLKVKLTSDDIDMARRYMVQGIYRDKAGKPIKDFNEVKRIYARDKWQSEREDAARERR